MTLNRQFCNLKQGDLSVAEYARRMKLLIAGLADIDYPVTEVDLTTQFLHGINKWLDTIRVVPGDMVPLPPFKTVFSRLKLVEENLSQREADDRATILAVTSGPTPAPPLHALAIDPPAPLIAGLDQTNSISSTKSLPNKFNQAIPAWTDSNSLHFIITDHRKIDQILISTLSARAPLGACPGAE
ncbi:hypothetical protein D1007_55325 [Hordeum vulgare]|nr:hypothetical protein D1007_55325 [Hordeum vulgare]